MIEGLLDEGKELCICNIRTIAEKEMDKYLSHIRLKKNDRPVECKRGNARRRCPPDPWQRHQFIHFGWKVSAELRHRDLGDLF
jgi:hypothetical protein